MQRLYFICPNIRKQISITFDIPEGKAPKGMYDVNCRHCAEMHRFYGKDVVRSHAVVKPKGIRIAR